MLEKLQIKNFQVHENFTLDLDPYVTVITGPNDVGKSAILRALRWVSLNDPTSGDKRWGTELSKVLLVIDGKTVIRKRGKSSSYFLDGKKFVAFRSDVPAEIRKLLKVSKINFQSQLDSHFWLSLSPPQVGREMNQIVNLGIIDTSLANIAKKERKQKATIEVIEARLEDARNQKKTLKWVGDAHIQLEEVEQKSLHLAAKQTSLAALGSILADIKGSVEAKRRLTEASVGGQNLLSSAQKLLENTQKAELLRNLVQTTIKASKVRNMDIPDLQPYELANQKFQELRILLHQIKEEEKKWDSIQSKLNETSKRLGKQKTCPVCLQPIP